MSAPNENTTRQLTHDEEWEIYDALEAEMYDLHDGDTRCNCAAEQEELGCNWPHCCRMVRT